MAVHESFLVHERFRWLKIAAGLSLLAIIAYVAFDPIGIHNGGTWLGYTLGTIGAGLIGWLTWLGIRKRRYDLGATKLKSWVSAHVYLGLSLLIIGTLHSGFQFGWNVHTLAYGLMVVVILSGIFGVYAYSRYPALMTVNRGGQTLDGMLRDLAELDRQARDAALPLGDDIANLVRIGQEKTKVGGGLINQLAGHDPNCPTAEAITDIEHLAGTLPTEMAERLVNLLTLLRRKGSLLARIRKDVQYKVLMEIWLYLHVPMTAALVVVLIVHIVSVFFYW